MDMTDIRAIALSIVLFLLSIIIVGGLWEYRDDAHLIVRSFVRRYVQFQWHGVNQLASTLADDADAADYVTDVTDSKEGSQNVVPPQGNVMEPDREPTPGNGFPADTQVVAFLGTLSDSALLDILAQVKQGEQWAFAESRIGKFIPGRVEDNIAQVRRVRGEAAPVAAPSPARIIRVNGGKDELVVDW